MANLGKGDLNCAGKCCKNMLFAFNAVFLICGLMALALGFFIVVFPLCYHISVLLGSNLYYIAGFLLIICGLAVIVVAFLGCCGARYENKSLLGGYFAAILCIFVLEFIAGILAMSFYIQAEVQIDDNLESGLLEQYGLEGEEELTAAWNYAQWWFECCGFSGNSSEGAAYYTSTIWFVTSSVRVPESCCTIRNYKIVNLHKCQDRQNIDWYTHINNEGCYDKFFNTAIQYSSIIAGVGITLSLIQLVGMVFSFCLFRSL